jgi:predicted dehydrogenase
VTKRFMRDSSVPFHKNHPESVRVGVIGIGNMGQHHVRVLSLMKDIKLVGISDVNVDRGLETASRYQTHFFEDYHELLLHVDAVCIAVPTRFHHAVGLAALKAGVHVLIEKPIAATISEAESLVNAAADSGCLLQVGHIERFNPVFQELSNVMKTEELVSLEAHRMSPYSDRANDVSVVLDLMIHDIDLCLELANSPVVRLTASGSKASQTSQYLDYVTATLGFANGIVATLTASKITHRKIRKISAHSKRSLTEADFLNNEIQIHRSSNGISAGLGAVGPASFTRPNLYRQDGIIEKVAIGRVEPLHAELEHFVACVRGGLPPFVGGEQALKALRLASLIEQMAMDGQVWHPVDLGLGPIETPMMAII